MGRKIIAERLIMAKATNSSSSGYLKGKTEVSLKPKLPLAQNNPHTTEVRPAVTSSEPPHCYFPLKALEFQFLFANYLPLLNSLSVFQNFICITYTLPPFFSSSLWEGILFLLLCCHFSDISWGCWGTLVFGLPCWTLTEIETSKPERILCGLLILCTACVRCQV